MEQIKTQVAKLRAELDKSPVSPLLHSLQEKTGLPYEYFVLGLAGILLIFLFFGVGASLIWCVLSALCSAVPGDGLLTLGRVFFQPRGACGRCSAMPAT